MDAYEQYIARKLITVPPAGIEQPGEIAEWLFPFQRDIVRWALQRGRAAIFADCGMGKTPMQLEWARHVVAHTGGRVLILAPLAVSSQTIREGAKFGIAVKYAHDASEVGDGITVTNYERIERFDLDAFAGVVLDESSILKAFDGKTRNLIINGFASTPFRLACTATPSPNDFMELGNHSQFLGVMTHPEMLAMFFVHDGGATQDWRIKGHAETEFWKWVCQWAVMIRKPSDLGYSDDGFVLPPLHMHEHVVGVEHKEAHASGMLFKLEALTLQEQRDARRGTIDKRVSKCAEMVNASDEPWLVWCELNAEGDALEKAIPGAVQVAGADSPEAKEAAMMGFADGSIRVLVTKPSIAGFGMNWQHCPNQAFVGLSHSYEQFYQAVRRCWRFGQKRDVHAHVITAETEGRVVANIQRKERDAMRMAEEMVKHMRDIQTDSIHATAKQSADYARDVAHGDNWTIHLGDCVDVVRSLPSASVGYSIFSPPFASLYTYSNSVRDMGNCATHDDFYEHFKHLVPELMRVTKPGRLLSFHCMNLPTSKARDGYIGLADFRGILIRAFQDAGWIYHSEVVIWKDPVTAMQRTKALGLLHKQIRKDASMSRQGIPDYLITMRKPGTNPDPIAHGDEEWDRSKAGLGNDVEVWQRYASPVWVTLRGEDDEGFAICSGMDDGSDHGTINPNETLQKESARDDKDERHICPLQLSVIRRALNLWTKPGDLVLSPFTGIGSEGYEAIKAGRKFVGAELKRSYWIQACANLAAVESRANTTGDLFAAIG